MELRCPECLSPEVGPRADGPAETLCCGNCGERFEREEAFVTVRDAESHVPAPVSEELFDLDARRARAALTDGAIRVVDPNTDTVDLHRLAYTAQRSGVIRAGREGAWISICPLSIREPDPVLAVDPGIGPKVLGDELSLPRHDDEDPVAFTVRVLEEMVGEANALAAGRAADSLRLDRITAYLNQPCHDVGDVCEFVGQEIVASGRRVLDVEG